MLRDMGPTSGNARYLCAIAMVVALIGASCGGDDAGDSRPEKAPSPGFEAAQLLVAEYQHCTLGTDELNARAQWCPFGTYQLFAELAETDITTDEYVRLLEGVVPVAKRAGCGTCVEVLERKLEGAKD
jgi:hypothetical protein